MELKKDKLWKCLRRPLRGWTLRVYDVFLLAFSNVLVLLVYLPVQGSYFSQLLLRQVLISLACVFGFRQIWGIYRQIWRFGGSTAYIRLIMSDLLAGIVFFFVQFLPWRWRISPSYAFVIISINLLLTLLIRHLYQYMYENASERTVTGRMLRRLAQMASGLKSEDMGGNTASKSRKIKIAIVGAGRVGVMLAEELRKNPRSSYEPCCFIDIDRGKIGRKILGLPVLPQDEISQQKLDSFSVQEIVFALPEQSASRKKSLYEMYQKTGCKLMVYDYPMRQADQSQRRQLREFDIEELLFRKPLQFTDENTICFYGGKVIMITGGGGSIGSELCRQIAKMKPKRIIIVDINENGAYELQQTMRMLYGQALDLCVEITNLCDRNSVERVFREYRPQVVFHAAAHKHVPLMEHNCIEAVRNNVFGTLNVVECAEKYRAEKFIMISSDKAVNPTNVMGATKRLCEMIIQSRQKSGTQFSTTRFGNVLGSNGSVIPLFRKQILHGGPVTLTDRRIVRYFMTIPEASQLVIQSGAMAGNGDLYVLDMGKPVKILDLAEDMIRLSGYEPYKDIDIVETGLRPGEKLYEELLVRDDAMERTENRMIFIEREMPEQLADVNEKIAILRDALETDDEKTVLKALRRVVPTYRSPEEINAEAPFSKEMRLAEKLG